jgi:hypothetical protein
VAPEGAWWKPEEASKRPPARRRATLLCRLEGDSGWRIPAERIVAFTKGQCSISRRVRANAMEGAERPSGARTRGWGVRLTGISQSGERCAGLGALRWERPAGLGALRWERRSFTCWPPLCHLVSAGIARPSSPRPPSPDSRGRRGRTRWEPVQVASCESGAAIRPQHSGGSNTSSGWESASYESPLTWCYPTSMRRWNSSFGP